MTIRTLAAALALAVLPLAPANAGQIKDWSSLTLTITSLDELECIAAFNKSNDAYAVCRNEALKLQYQAHAEKNQCDRVADWDNAIKQLTGKGNTYDKLTLKQDGRIEYEKSYGIRGARAYNGVTLGNVGDFSVMSGTMTEPTEEQRISCNESRWISTRLNDEIFALRGITAAKKPTN